MSNMTSVSTMPQMVQAPVTAGPRPMSMPSTGPSITVQDVVRILKRFLFLLIGIFTLVMIATIVGTYFWAKYYPSYRAVGLVEVRSPIAPQALQSETITSSKDIIEQHINTQAARIRSQGILQKAINAPQVKDTNWYRSFGLDTNSAQLDMESRLSAAPIRDTWFIQVSFVWRNPQECETIVNAVLDAYLRDAKSGSQEKTRVELDQYQKRGNDLRTELRRKVEDQERFRASRNIPLIEQRRTNIGDEVTALTGLLAEAMTQRDQAQALYEMYNQAGAMERMADTPEMRFQVDNDPMVRYYTGQLADLRIALEASRERGSRNRNVKDLDNRIKLVEKELNAKKREAISNTFRDMRERTRVQLDTINMQVIGLQNRFAEKKAELSELEAQLAKYLTTEQEIEILRKQLETVEDYVLKLRIQLENPELVRVSIAAPAVRPLERSNPKWAVNLPAGFVLGLLLGVGLAFMLEFMSTTVKTPADVLRQLHMPLLGQIPSQDEEESSPAQMHKVLLESPHSMLAESFRQLRANLLFCAPSEGQKSILVTSCSPMEGKTCISVNLATSLALAGRKVLLVDANFRRPVLVHAFEIKNAAEGLSNILIGHKDPASLIQKTQHQNLDVLPAGPLPPNPAELLSGGYLKEFIRQFGEKYETIMFDGPPILVVSDAMVLSTVVDGVVMVIRSGLSSRGAIGRAKDQLKRAGAKLLGVALNDVKITRGGYFREMYKTYYEYQTPTAAIESGQETQNG
ncbi:MAG: polysaccharide biosynthesis tyrosine autokinase [Phycisphaerae bacterium]|nr:polysaccharide biosynthesis tyrosine autokinase [Phycisphaerae bacterium]